MNKIEAAAADWMIGLLTGTDVRILTQFAADQGIGKSYASKLQAKIAEKVAKRLAK
jgi:hypothetical protein